MSENIVHGRYLITRASGHETSVLEQGAIYQNNGVIKEVGAFQELSQKHPDVPVLGGDDFSGHARLDQCAPSRQGGQSL